MNPIRDIVCILLETPFSTWREEDKRDVVAEGRPTESLKITGMKGNKKPRLNNSIVRFKPKWFSMFPWLCSSLTLQKLYCWPCLLFATKQSAWNGAGYEDLLNGAKKHDDTPDHIKCQSILKTFEKELNLVQNTEADALNGNARLIKLKYNENVRLNRIVFRTLIDAALYVDKQELQCRGHEHQNDFKELLELLISRSPLEIRNHYDKNKTVFSKDLTTIKNEVNMCISNYINAHIEKEIKEADFFSILVNDATDITQSSRCSLIIRYVNSKGEIVERFFGFYDISAERTSDAVYNMLSPILKHFDCKNKMIGQCYDGASINPDYLNLFRGKMKDIAPLAVFVHSLEHRLDRVLQESLKKIMACRMFFASLGGISSFLHYLSNRYAAFDSTPDKKLPTIETRWCSRFNLIYTIVEDWLILKEVLEFFITFEHSDEKSIQSARVILNDMNDFDFTFLVIVFNDIFSAIDILYKILQEHSLETSVCLQQILQTREMLHAKQKDDYFDAIFNKANVLTVLNVSEDTKDLDTTTKYKVLYHEILDHVLMEMDIRFQDFYKLFFVPLADPKKFQSHWSCFPGDTFHSLLELHGDMFKSQRLKNELCLVYSNQNLMNTSLQEVLISLAKDKDVFTEAYRMFSFAATIPSTFTSFNRRSFSYLEHMQVPHSISKERLSCLAIISIEDELLCELKNGQVFYEDIIAEYASLENREIDLVYKD